MKRGNVFVRQISPYWSLPWQVRELLVAWWWLAWWRGEQDAELARESYPGAQKSLFFREKDRWT